MKPDEASDDMIEFVSKLNPERIPEPTRRRVLAMFGGATAASLAGCMGMAPRADSSEDADDEPEPVELPVLNPAVFVPMLFVDDTPQFNNQLRLKDYTAVKQGLYMSGALARSSEMGNENYRENLADEYMQSQGEQCLSCLGEIMDCFWEDGKLVSKLEETDDGWIQTDTVDITTYSMAGYTYHAHHRGNRWLGEGHEDVYQGMTYDCPPYISSLGEYLLDNHYENGRFYHDTDREEFDNRSMAHGLAGINPLSYAWVRWATPDGDGDMGVVNHAVLEAFLGYTDDDLLALVDEIIPVLDEHWDDSAGIYDFGDGTEYDLATLGALIRGHKGLYEIPAIFGEDPTKGKHLAERVVRMLDPLIVDITQPWGLPTTVRYTDTGVEPTSKTTDVGMTWEFITYLTGAWSITRERDGEESPQLIEQIDPEFMDRFGEFTDELLIGSLDYQLDDEGSVVTELDYETGEITDDTQSAVAIGHYLTGTGNVYRSHEAVERARDWDDVEDEELLEQSKRFHDRYVDNAMELRRFVQT